MTPEAEDNARLVAAAPALLAVCKAAEWGYEGCASPACPVCGGIKPQAPECRAGYDWDGSGYGHRDDCKLRAAIEAAEKGEPS